MLSANYIHYYGCILNGWADFEPNKGICAHTCNRVMKCKGVCDETYWPNDKWSVRDIDIEAADDNAFKHRNAFFQEMNSVEDMKKAIYMEKAVGATIRLFESIKNADESGIIPLPNDDEISTDEHAICIYGYSDNLVKTYENMKASKGFFVFANSWGKSWGEAGSGYISYDYFEKYHTEAFAVRSILSGAAIINDYNIDKMNFMREYADRGLRKIR